MSFLANLDIIDKILIILLILVILKIIYDVNGFMKKRKEFLKLKEQEQARHLKKSNETEFEENNENADENDDENRDENVCEYY